MQIDEALRAAGAEPLLVSGRRVTDALALKAAIRAAGSARMEVEARLSKVLMLCCDVL
jgi:amino-acid N-acetyltransferase